jgi:hypothetical protein
MVVFCPGCGSKISVQPATPGGAVECPRCRSSFPTAGLKPADDLPQPRRFRPKKPGRGRPWIAALILILLLGGATGAILYAVGILHWPGSTPSSELGTRSHPKNAKPGWTEFESSEAHVRLLLPGEPKRTARRATKDVAYELEKDGVAYGVVYADLDQARLRSRTPEQIIQGQHDQWAAGNKGTLASEKDVKAGDFKGKEFVVDLPTGKAYMRYFAAGRRLYTVMVVGKTRDPDPADVAAVFDSFAITG